MNHFKTLGYDDASAYFNNTIATNKETHEDFFVALEPTDSGRPRYTVYNANNRDNRLRPKEFFDNYLVGKFSLGWVNFKHGSKFVARYLSARPGRRMRKGYISDELEWESPYEAAVSSTITSITRTAKLPTENREEALQKIIAQTDMYKRHLRSLVFRSSNILDTIMGSVRFPQMFTVDEVIDNFSSEPTKSGMAMTPAIAACINTNFFQNCAGLYYHRKLVGYVSSEFHLFQPFEHLIPEFERDLGISPIIENP